MSILASDRGDRPWWRIGNLKRYVFNCFLNPEILSTVLMTWGSLFHCVGAANVKLHNSERFFCLDEEIDRRLPHVRSLCLIREDRYGGWLKIYCFISKEVKFEQHTVMNREPV